MRGTNKEMLHYGNRQMRLQVLKWINGWAMCRTPDGLYLVGSVLKEGGQFLLASPNEYSDYTEAVTYFGLVAFEGD